MHSKQTVKYICEQFTNGHTYYYKQEYITHNSWMDLSSIAWSAPRPISKKTFLKREAEGYTCQYIQKHPAVILPFAKKKNKARPHDS